MFGWCNKSLTKLQYFNTLVLSIINKNIKLLINNIIYMYIISVRGRGDCPEYSSFYLKIILINWQKYNLGRKYTH